MKVNQKDWDPKGFLEDLKKRSEEQSEKEKEQEEKLKQRILFEWDQCNSITFWTQCFLYTPLKVINRIFNNVNGLDKTDYPVRNKAGLFVAILKKMGYFPWKEQEGEKNKKNDQ